ncbi:MAG: chaperone modulator CbpM [Pseudomonadota bacterium]
MMTEFEALAQIKGLSRTRLEICIREAWITPARSKKGHVFDDVDLARLRLISELADDLLIDDNAMPIVLSLIDQIHGLKRRLHELDEALGADAN